jgi:hypothetical protein
LVAEVVMATEATLAVVAALELGATPDSVSLQPVPRLHNASQYDPRLVKFFTEPRFVCGDQAAEHLRHALTECATLRGQVQELHVRVETLTAQGEGQFNLIQRLKGQLAALQEGDALRAEGLAAQAALVASLQAAMADLADKQDFYQQLVSSLADATGKLSWLCVRGIPNMCVDVFSPLLAGYTLMFVGMTERVFALPFLSVPEGEGCRYNKQTTRLENYNVLGHDLRVLDPDYLTTLEQSPALTASGGGWNLDRYWDLYNKVMAIADGRMEAARTAAGVRNPHAFMPAADISDIDLVRVGIRDGIIVEVRWPQTAGLLTIPAAAAPARPGPGPDSRPCSHGHNTLPAHHPRLRRCGHGCCGGCIHGCCGHGCCGHGCCGHGCCCACCRTGRCTCCPRCHSPGCRTCRCTCRMGSGCCRSRGCPGRRLFCRTQTPTATSY